ncbi:MAG: hypothetical protein AAF293_08435 [Pseudomonadota bacterium]
MVDHRADDDRSLRSLLGQGTKDGWAGATLITRISDWFARLWGAPDHRQASTAAFHRRGPDQSSASRLALVVSALWVAALAAYGVGYFTRLGTGEGAVRSLPTLDLIFFAFAIIGPVAMLWVVVALLNRAERLSDAISGQSESALALASTINNLNDSVDALASNTTGRLEQACDRMEREAAASVVALDKALKASTEKLETALLDGVILMDSNMRERSERTGASMEQHQDEVTAVLKSAVAALQTAMKAEVERIGTVREGLAEAVDTGSAEVRAKIDSLLGEIATSHSEGIKTANAAVQASAETAAGDLASSVQARIDSIDERLRASNAEIAAVASDTSATVRKDLTDGVRALREDLEQVKGSVAAHPPASAEDLAALMGEAVHRIVSPERTALTQSVLRITALEEQARTLIEKIDRSSRLAPWMGEVAKTAPVVASHGNPALPLGEVPTSEERRALNWTSVVHVLAGLEAVPGTQGLIDETLRDPDLTALIRLRDQVIVGLGADGLFPDDVLPEHAEAAVWQAFVQQQNAEEVAALAGVNDNVANAIARGWLRRDPEHQQLAFRFVEAYRVLIARAVDDVGADSRLVELAETSAGRYFILLGGLLGVFGAPRETG